MGGVLGARPVHRAGRAPTHPQGGRHLIEVGEVTREKLRRLGPAGRDWLDGLPALVASLERRWSFTVDEALAGGTAAYVARVRTAGGGAVLKVLVPDPVFDHQIRTLVEARGRAYARVLAHDAGARAVLLEELGPALDGVDLPVERKLTLLARALREAWRVPPWPELAVPTAGRDDKATLLAGLVGELWDELAAPCPRPVVDRALSYAARRAAALDPARLVVVHGDPHPANALRAADGRGFVFIDPDGFLAEPEYDLGVVLRGWCTELLAADDPVASARRYRDLLVAETGADPTALWEWSYLERVSSGLYLCAIGATDLGRAYLASAERLID